MADRATCSQCGAAVAADDVFCGSCGSAVSTAAAPQSRTAVASQPAASAPAASVAAPGWYPNPDGGGQRYWDGRQWTGQPSGARTVTVEPRHHRVLRTARGLSLVFAWLTLVFGSIGIVVEVAGESEIGVASGLFFLILIAQVVWLGLTCVLLFSYPVLIKLSLDIEQVARGAVGGPAR